MTDSNAPLPTNAPDLQNWLCQRGLRVGAHMAAYVLKHLANPAADGSTTIAIMGTHARTGIPLIARIDRQTHQFTCSA